MLKQIKTFGDDSVDSVKKTTSLITAALFLLQQFLFQTPLRAYGPSGPEAASASPFPVTEVGAVREPPLQIDLPPGLGTIDHLVSGSGPVIFHIQEAHGNVEGQKKIRKILERLKDRYRVDTVFLEGTAFQLDPELLRFYPDKMDITMGILDRLAEKSLITGPEMFLVENGFWGLTPTELGSDPRRTRPAPTAYGIEDLSAYLRNVKSFQDVLRAKEKSKKFLQALDLQITLAGASMNPELRMFLKNVGAGFPRPWRGSPEAARPPKGEETSPLQRLSYIKEAAKKRLEVDLDDPAFQLDWPMLVRVFTLKRIEEKLDLAKFEKERGRFLKSVRPLIVGAWFPRPSSQEGGETPPLRLYNQIHALLSTPLSRRSLPDPGARLLFEEMVSHLPKNFRYAAYPNVNLFIGHLILQSELKADRLLKEIEMLTDQIADHLAKDPKEKEIVRLLKDYRLLQRLFALELTPEDWDKMNSNVGATFMAPFDSKGVMNHAPTAQALHPLRPSAIFHRLLSLNTSRRVRDIDFLGSDPNIGVRPQYGDLDRLFDLALEFYRGTQERDRYMLENIEKHLHSEFPQAVAVITGGFHAAPFQEYFQKRGCSYALITPKLSDPDQGRDRYLRTVMESSTLGLVSRGGLTERQMLQSGLPKSEARRYLTALAREVFAVRRSQDIPAAQIRAEIRRMPRFRSETRIPRRAYVGANLRVRPQIAGQTHGSAPTKIRNTQRPRSEARINVEPMIAEEIAKGSIPSGRGILGFKNLNEQERNALFGYWQSVKTRPFPQESALAIQGNFGPLRDMLEIIRHKEGPSYVLIATLILTALVNWIFGEPWLQQIGVLDIPGIKIGWWIVEAGLAVGALSLMSRAARNVRRDAYWQLLQVLKNLEFQVNRMVAHPPPDWPDFRPRDDYRSEVRSTSSSNESNESAYPLSRKRKGWSQELRKVDREVAEWFSNGPRYLTQPVLNETIDVLELLSELIESREALSVHTLLWRNYLRLADEIAGLLTPEFKKEAVIQELNRVLTAILNKMFEKATTAGAALKVNPPPTFEEKVLGREQLLSDLEVFRRNLNNSDFRNAFLQLWNQDWGQSLETRFSSSYESRPRTFLQLGTLYPLEFEAVDTFIMVDWHKDWHRVLNDMLKRLFEKYAKILPSEISDIHIRVPAVKETFWTIASDNLKGRINHWRKKLVFLTPGILLQNLQASGYSVSVETELSGSRFFEIYFRSSADSKLKILRIHFDSEYYDRIQGPPPGSPWSLFRKISPEPVLSPILFSRPFGESSFTKAGFFDILPVGSVLTPAPVLTEVQDPRNPSLMPDQKDAVRIFWMMQVLGFKPVSFPPAPKKLDRAFIKALDHDPYSDFSTSRLIPILNSIFERGIFQTAIRPDDPGVPSILEVHKTLQAAARKIAEAKLPEIPKQRAPAGEPLTTAKSEALRSEARLSLADSSTARSSLVAMSERRANALSLAVPSPFPLPPSTRVSRRSEARSVTASLPPVIHWAEAEVTRAAHQEIVFGNGFRIRVSDVSDQQAQLSIPPGDSVVRVIRGRWVEAESFSTQKPILAPASETLKENQALSIQFGENIAVITVRRFPDKDHPVFLIETEEALLPRSEARKKEEGKGERIEVINEDQYESAKKKMRRVLAKYVVLDSKDIDLKTGFKQLQWGDASKVRPILSKVQKAFRTRLPRRETEYIYSYRQTPQSLLGIVLKYSPRSEARGSAKKKPRRALPEKVAREELMRVLISELLALGAKVDGAKKIWSLVQGLPFETVQAQLRARTRGFSSSESTDRIPPLRSEARATDGQIANVLATSGNASYLSQEGDQFEFTYEEIGKRIEKLLRWMGRSPGILPFYIPPVDRPVGHGLISSYLHPRSEARGELSVGEIESRLNERLEVDKLTAGPFVLAQGVRGEWPFVTVSETGRGVNGTTFAVKIDTPKPEIRIRAALRVLLDKIIADYSQYRIGSEIFPEEREEPQGAFAYELLLRPTRSGAKSEARGVTASLPLIEWEEAEVTRAAHQEIVFANRFKIRVSDVSDKQAQLSIPPGDSVVRFISGRWVDAESFSTQEPILAPASETLKENQALSIQFEKNIAVITVRRFPDKDHAVFLIETEEGLLPRSEARHTVRRVNEGMATRINSSGDDISWRSDRKSLPRLSTIQSPRSGSEYTSSNELLREGLSVGISSLQTVPKGKRLPLQQQQRSRSLRPVPFLNLPFGAAKRSNRSQRIAQGAEKSHIGFEGRIGKRSRTLTGPQKEFLRNLKASSRQHPSDSVQTRSPSPLLRKRRLPDNFNKVKQKLQYRQSQEEASLTRSEARGQIRETNGRRMKGAVSSDVANRFTSLVPRGVASFGPLHSKTRASVPSRESVRSELRSMETAPAKFDDDLNFLKEHLGADGVIVLSDESGKAQVAVVPAYQGRVMTSTGGGPEGPSFGWVNRGQIEQMASGRFNPQMNVAGGEDRFWLGPEGGQFALFFPPGASNEFRREDWRTPAVMDTEPFYVVASDRHSVTFTKQAFLRNYSGTPFDIKIDRTVRLLSKEEARKKLDIESLPASLNVVAYESDNKITNRAKEVWSKERGLLSIWILGMFNPSPGTTVFIPFHPGNEGKLGPVVKADYFGQVPPERLVVKDKVLFFRGDSQHRGKIGLSPRRAKPILGSYDSVNKVLTLVQYTQPEGKADYVNSAWEQQKNPYGGDVVNAYNDDGGLGKFYELESSSPAAELVQDQSISHTHRTFHIQGTEKELDEIAWDVLGVSLAEIKNALPRSEARANLGFSLIDKEKSDEVVLYGGAGKFLEGGYGTVVLRPVNQGQKITLQLVELVKKEKREVGQKGEVQLNDVKIHQTWDVVQDAVLDLGPYHFTVTEVDVAQNRVVLTPRSEARIIVGKTEAVLRAAAAFAQNLLPPGLARKAAALLMQKLGISLPGAEAVALKPGLRERIQSSPDLSRLLKFSALAASEPLAFVGGGEPSVEEVGMIALALSENRRIRYTHIFDTESALQSFRSEIRQFVQKEMGFDPGRLSNLELRVSGPRGVSNAFIRALPVQGRAVLMHPDDEVLAQVPPGRKVAARVVTKADELSKIFFLLAQLEILESLVRQRLEVLQGRSLLATQEALRVLNQIQILRKLIHTAA